LKNKKDRFERDGVAGDLGDSPVATAVSAETVLDLLAHNGARSDNTISGLQVLAIIGEAEGGLGAAVSGNIIRRSGAGHVQALALTSLILGLADVLVGASLALLFGRSTVVEGALGQPPAKERNLGKIHQQDNSQDSPEGV
jgi:hypothetical protein